MVECVDPGARLPGSNHSSLLRLCGRRQLPVPLCAAFIGCKGELMIVPASSGYYED